MDIAGGDVPSQVDAVAKLWRAIPIVLLPSPSHPLAHPSVR